MSEQVSILANVVIADVSTENSPAISLGGAPIGGNSQTGIFGGYDSVGTSVKGVEVMSLDENGILYLSNDVVVFSGATAPVSGASGTGDNFAGKGSFYIALDTGAWYQQTGAITSPTWVIIEAGSASVLATPLTGYVSGAGSVSASDTILQGFNKLNGNAAAISTVANAALPSASFTSAAVTGKVLTGLAAGSATPILSTDTILVALANLQAQISAI